MLHYLRNNTIQFASVNEDLIFIVAAPLKRKRNNSPYLRFTLAEQLRIYIITVTIQEDYTYVALIMWF